MIAMVRGRVVESSASGVVIDVNGVGYDVSVPGRTALRLAGEVTLWIHTSVREDAIQLFGFESQSEKALFQQLITVQSVGPRTGLNALDALTADALARAINAGDLRALGQISGVGKKTAERIVLELKGKVSAPVGEVVAPAAKVDDAFALALAQLGFKKSEIDTASAHLAEEGMAAAPLAERIAAALRRMGASR